MSKQLLPCPFCGGDAALATQDPQYSGTHGYAVHCKSRECCLFHERLHGNFIRESGAIAAWNRRTPSAQVPRVEPQHLDALKEASKLLANRSLSNHPGPLSSALSTIHQMLTTQSSAQAVPEGFGPQLAQQILDDLQIRANCKPDSDGCLDLSGFLVDRLSEIAASAVPGFVLVPRKPTEDMLAAIADAVPCFTAPKTHRRIYDSALDAAPAAPAAEPQGEAREAGLAAQSAIREVAIVEELLDDNCARVRWMFNPVPEGQTLLWDHGDAPTPTDDESRAAFERWVTDNGNSPATLDRDYRGDYVNGIVNSLWGAWQACARTLARPVESKE